MSTAWTDREDALLGTMTDSALAAKLGRTRRGVEQRRAALDIAAYTPHSRKWSKTELALLGTMSDAKLAAKLGVSRRHVLQVRQRKRVAAFSPANTPKKFRRKRRKAVCRT